VLDACLAINPRLFAASSPEEEGEGATADTQATAEDAANAMIAYIVTLELLEQVVYNPNSFLTCSPLQTVRTL
jgi:hypothetical protein